jgi:hypothetical protein
MSVANTLCHANVSYPNISRLEIVIWVRNIPASTADFFAVFYFDYTNIINTANTKKYKKK